MDGNSTWCRKSSMKKVSLVRTYTSRDGVYFETDRTLFRNFAFTLSMAARLKFYI